MKPAAYCLPLSVRASLVPSPRPSSPSLPPPLHSPPFRRSVDRLPFPLWPRFPPPLHSPSTRRACMCARSSPLPPHRRGQQCSNVRVSIFVRFAGCTGYTRRAATGIYTGIIRETAATSRHTDRPDGRRIKSTGRSSVSGTANPIETVFQPTTESNVIATQGWSLFQTRIESISFFFFFLFLSLSFPSIIFQDISRDNCCFVTNARVWSFLRLEFRNRSRSNILLRLTRYGLAAVWTNSGRRTRRSDGSTRMTDDVNCCVFSPICISCEYFNFCRAIPRPSSPLSTKNAIANNRRFG